MVLTTGTIHDVLARRNPTLDVKTGKGGNTKDPRWYQVKYSSLRPVCFLFQDWIPSCPYTDTSFNTQWRDFTYQNLLNGWGHILSIQGAKGKFEDEISDSQKEILDEDKIDSVAESWNVECLRDPLKKGAAAVRGVSQPDITIKKKYMQYPRSQGRALEPDMAIFLKDGNRTTSTSLVMGDNKCATKWTHHGLTPAVAAEETMEPLWPIRQILTYCVHGRTRYGYIMTTSEVVVFRMSNNPSTSDPAKYIVEWAFVPWSNSGEGKLTVNLAIWWLGMMSLADKHRKIVLPPSMYPVDTWQKWKAKDGKDKYTHILSRRTITSPPSAHSHIIKN